MTLKSVYKQNQSFFLGYFFLLIVAAFVFLVDSKKAGFILLNPYHTNFLNYLFEGFTLIGDGIFSVVVCLALLLMKKRNLSFMVFAGFATSGIVAQVLKAFISEARPALFLKKSSYPYFIDHVTLHNFHSFPSGHTTSAFALVAILAFAFKDKKYAIPLLALGALVGYSRIYLGQHFLHDVVAGSLIGVFFSIICWIGFAKVYEKLKKKQGSKSST
ncbi:MAG TPA: phosphatase PAP2 family protein [Hanamia sp.]|nr:phosphatase PAP2 family protein [Hanamia sp.]